MATLYSAARKGYESAAGESAAEAAWRFFGKNCQPARFVRVTAPDGTVTRWSKPDVRRAFGMALVCR